MQGAAPVYSIADDARARAEAEAWSRFASAEDATALCRNWLGLMALRLQRTRAGLVLLGEPGAESYGVAAAWPDPSRDLQYLGSVAERALTERRGILAASDGGEPRPELAAHVAYPLLVGTQLRGAVVFDLGAGPLAELQNALRQIHLASAWLIDHFRQEQLRATEAELARVAGLNEVLATALQHPQLRTSALAVANDLAARLHCDRVSVGFERDDRIEPLAISHTATFDPKSDLVRTLADAMDEVLDLAQPVQWPLPEGDERGALVHGRAAPALDAQAMLSVPVQQAAEVIGVVTLERQQGPAFSARDARLAQAVATMLAPVWALQRAEQRPWRERLALRWRAALGAWFGPRHPGLKLGGALLVLLLAFTAFWPAAHRVSARTVIEGATQLAQVAPFDGYVAEALVRAGDTVKRGQLMARLDDRDLLLERARWQSELAQAGSRYQVALAQADRANMVIVAAQVQQAEAQLALVEGRLERARLTAPFDGLVVFGDLSQLIGTPVDEGHTLFEVAPLEGYRVVLQVDDRDIAGVAEGQRGELVLSSLPGQVWPFTVSTVTAVATQHEGRNVFRVEAQVEGPSPRLRPGMEGVGKIVVGERSLLWVWTHGFVDWLRLTAWTWLP